MTPIDELRTTKEKLPPQLCARIIALGAEAAAPLIEILEGESSDAGWAPDSRGRLARGPRSP